MVQERWSCALTGTLASMTHRMARQRLAKLGVSVRAAPSAGVDFIVVGARPSRHKLAEAEAAQVPRVDERQLTALLGGLTLDSVLAMRPSAEGGGDGDPIQATLERLRGVLYAPSREAWEAACAVLEGCPSASVEVAVDYVEAATAQGWGRGAEGADVSPFYSLDGELRAAPRRWRERLLAGRPVVGARLIRSLSLGRQRVSRAAIERICANAQLSGVRCLELTSLRPTAAHLGLLAQSPMARGLEALDLRRNGLIDNAVEGLMRGSWPALRVLDVSRNYLCGHFLRRLAGVAPGLETLNVGFNPLMPDALGVFTQARWPALRALCLANAGLNDDAMAHIARGAWSGLERLDVSRNALWDEGVEAIAAAEWPALEVLCVQHTSCGGRGLAALTASEAMPALRRLLAHELRLSELREGLFRGRWPRLEHVGLSGCGLDDRGLGAALARAQPLPALESLNVANNRLGVAGLARLLGCEALRAVRVLDVAYNDLGGGGGEALARARGWERLERLSLSRCGLDDRDVVALIGAEAASRLTHLDLSVNRALGDGAARALAEATHMTRLRALSLAGSPIGEGAARALLDAPHLAGLERLEVLVCEPLSAAFEEAYVARFGARGAALSLKRTSYRDAMA